MDLVLIVAAAAEVAEEHKSEAPFFIAGGVLAAFAVLISVLGFRRPDFPSSNAAARGVMGVGTVLVAAAMYSAVYVAT